MEDKKKADNAKTVYIVCDNSKEVFPRSILRIYYTKESAYRFLGKYVSELNQSTYTGYLNIAEKQIGDSDTIIDLGTGEQYQNGE